MNAIDIVNRKPNVADESEGAPDSSDNQSIDGWPTNSASHWIGIIWLVEKEGEGIEECYECEDDGIEDVVYEVEGAIWIGPLDTLIERQEQDLTPCEKLRQDD